MKQQHLSSFGRLTHPARLILLSLRDHPMGGRELLAMLQEAQSWLEPGTLWVALSRLERAGLISPLSPNGSWQQTRRYDVTDAGLSVLSQERDALFGAPGRIGPRPSRGVLHGWIMILIKWIVRLYPKAWRERYEQEMIELLGAHEITFWTWLDLLWNALDARLDPIYRRSVSLSPFRRLRRVQWAILVTVLLPLFSAVSYWTFLFIGGLHGDYWVRNAHYPILALIHNLGTIGINVTMFCALLVCIQFAYQGIKRFGRPGDALFHRLVLVAMCFPVATPLLASFFPFLGSFLAEEEVGKTMFVGSILLISLLLAGWGVVRPEAFRRAFLHLLPWLGINLCALTLALGDLLYPPPDNTTPFYQPIALASLLSVPFTFAVAMIRLRLCKRLRSTLLTLATVGTLGMTLVQLMMVMRLIVLHFLGLSTIWTSELIVELCLNVLCTALALVFLLTILPLRKRKAPPAIPVEERVVMPLS